MFSFCTQKYHQRSSLLNNGANCVLNSLCLHDSLVGSYTVFKGILVILRTIISFLVKIGTQNFFQLKCRYRFLLPQNSLVCKLSEDNNIQPQGRQVKTVGQPFSFLIPGPHAFLEHTLSSYLSYSIEYPQLCVHQAILSSHTASLDFSPWLYIYPSNVICNSVAYSSLFIF